MRGVILQARLTPRCSREILSTNLKLLQKHADTLVACQKILANKQYLIPSGEDYLQLMSVLQHRGCYRSSGGAQPFSRS
jgi:hypothetical protein